MHFEYFSVFFSGGVHFVYFVRVQSHGLFDNDVLAAGQSFENVRLVQVVGRRDEHDFYAFIGKNLFGAVEVMQSQPGGKFLSFLADVVYAGNVQLFGIIAVV